VERAKKVEMVASLKQTFDAASLVVVTHQSGLSVAESTDLRVKMREGGAGFRVTKNRLAKLALVGTQYESLVDLFTGPTAIAYSTDPIAAARVVDGFAKGNEKLTIVGGAMGADVLDIDQVKALAKLPSLDELRAKLAGLIKMPATNIAGVLQAPAGQLARVFSAYADKGEAA
jgi:large subunit ribosomal protein L10